MGDICDVDTHFEITIRQLSCVESVVDILAPWRIDTANEKVPEIPASSPTDIVLTFWYSPTMAL